MTKSEADAACGCPHLGEEIYKTWTETMDASNPDDFDISELVRELSDKYQVALEVVDDLLEEIRQMILSYSDPYALQDYFKTRKDEVQSAFQEHRRALTDLNIDSFNSLLKVNVPTTITATVAAGLVAAPIAPVIAGVGITVGLVTWWTEVSRKTKDANKSPWHYLLSIKELTPPPEATPIYMYPLF